jgi:hypothetical protein
MSDEAAQRLYSKMLQRGMPPAAALGFLGNFSVESRLDSGINELAPIVPGSRGGFGLSQWTGPRRRQLEAFAADRGAPVSDEDTQLDFLMYELSGPERSAGQAILAAADPETAARLVSEKFLRPGIPHLDRRIAATRQFAGAVSGDAPFSFPQQNALAPAAMPTRQENALSKMAIAQQLAPQTAMLDPEMFMNRRRY